MLPTRTGRIQDKHCYSEEEEEKQHQVLVGPDSAGAFSSDYRALLGSSDQFREVSIGHICGTINADEVMRFKKLLFRATRGKN